jgi:hypothetical protein
MRCKQFILSVTLYFTQEQEENKTTLLGCPRNGSIPTTLLDKVFFLVTLREERQRVRAERWLIAVISVRGEGGANP